jgi:hypothetical protein
MVDTNPSEGAAARGDYTNISEADEVTATVTSTGPGGRGLSGTDMNSANRPYDVVNLTSSVAATETTQTDLPSASPSAVIAARSGEGGQIRVLGNQVSLEDETARAFIEDCARNLEGLLSDRQLTETWGLDDDELVRLADNTFLLGAVKAERERRIRMGDAVREAAQRHFAKAPSILNEILQNETISPRHRIEAAHLDQPGRRSQASKGN